MYSRENYKTHLASSYWREFKDQYRPRYCQWPNGCLSFPSDGHHLTYQHFGHEKEYPKDIAFYCRKHHDLVHFNALGQRRKNWRQYNFGGTSTTSVYLLIVLLIILILSWIIYQIVLYFHF